MLFFPFLPHQPPSSFTQPTHLNSKRAWKSFQRTRAIKMRLGSHWLGLKPALPLVTTRPCPESTEGSSNPHQHWHATLNLLPIDSLQRTFCFSILSVKHGAVWSPPPLPDNALYRILNPTGNEQGVKFRRKSNEEVVGGLTSRPLLSFFCQVWCHTSVILAFKKLKQDDHGLDASLHNIVRLCLDKNKTKQTISNVPQWIGAPVAKH